MIDSSIVTLIGLGSGALVLAFVFLLPSRRSKEEAGLPVLYEERCSGRTKLRFGLFAGGNMSSWRISLYDTFLVIAFIGPTKIPYPEVESVDYRRHWISKGMSIKRRNSKIDVILFPKHPKKILAILKAKGVPVSEN